MRHCLLAARTMGRLAPVVLASLAVGSAVAGVAAGSQGASGPAAVSASVASPPTTVTGTLIARRTGTLGPGTVVRSANLGLRVFPNAQHGFALADVGQAQYPARTANGGRTWRINGPALHVNAAQAPLVVLQVGAANQHAYFAWGGPGGGQVVDVTNDAGRHWWQAILGDIVMAVVAGADGRLVALAQNAPASHDANAQTVVYISKDGGRHWSLDTRIGAG